MSETVIKIDGVCKQYRLGEVGTGTLSHDLNRLWCKVIGKEDPYEKVGEINDRTIKSGSGYVQVLNDINLDVKKGEILGIIGKNGAGKSTLLKILSKVTGPTQGQIKTKGRIASLLEVGTGFHPELTGRDNIYMNGTLMGMSRKEISQKLDEIVSFAGIERYLDTPVKRYSSGMTVRLGFAIAAHLDPEIMIVDEVLAVGDIEFQKKAIGKMQDVSEKSGRTVLFVSHNMSAIRRLCSRAIVLDKGAVSYSGNVDEAIKQYINADAYNTATQANFNTGIIRQARLLDANGELSHGSLMGGDKLTLSLTLDTRNIDKSSEIRIVISDRAGETIAVASSGLMNGFYLSEENKEVVVHFDSTPLLPNDYYISIDIYIPWQITYESQDKLLAFSIIEHDINGTGFSYSSVWNPKMYVPTVWKGK